MKYTRLKSCCVALICLLAASLVTPRTAHSAGWFDSFDNGSITDGDPLTWTFNEIGASPGVYDASSGDLRLSAPGDPMPVLPTDPSDNNLVPSVDVLFDNTFARTQVVAFPDDLLTEARVNAGIAVRWNPTTVTGYVVLIDHGDQLEVLRLDGGVPTPLDIQQDIGVNALTDAVLEVHAIGSEISVFAWQAGDSKPSAPISMVTDGTYSTGRTGLFVNEDSDGHIGVFRYAAAQDAPFVPGDFDDDQDVDGFDLAEWQTSYGASGGADADFDGDSDGNDFLAWQRNLGTGTGAAVGETVPEPTAIVMSSIAIIAFSSCSGCSRYSRHS